ncbi:hypothetical protein [Crenothrix sp.]|uniref:hypothetical protein n=1 Tax=Crenothrix sp. TaxID=3100433 RepID=UPI00374C9E65
MPIIQTLDMRAYDYSLVNGITSCFKRNIDNFPRDFGHNIIDQSYDHLISTNSLVKTFKAIAITTTLSIIVNPSISSKPVTARPYVHAKAKDQHLNTDRVDLKMIARIRDIGMYSNGWDGSNGKAASNAAINEAEMFVRQLSLNTKEPIITLAADGEINFLWVFSDFRLDLGIYGDNSYSYYGKKSDGKEFLADEKLINEKLPTEILALINQNNIH